MSENFIESSSNEKKSSSYDYEKTLEDHTMVDGTASEISQIGFINRWAAKLNAETKGIELVTDAEKTDSSLWSAASMWLSANLVVATWALGALGITVFGLSFWQCVLVIIFFSFLGVTPVAWLSCFGPKLGLRQMILSKFMMGDLPMRIFSVINMIACVGWGAVNIMASAQLLNVINNGACPPWAGCLILVICTLLVTFFGYHIIHLYEKWSFIPNLVVFIAIIARMSIAGTFTTGEWATGRDAIGGVLSFGGAVYGFATGWTTYASDYTVYQPRNTNSYKIFFSILVGLWTPIIFTMVLGAACATGTLTNKRWDDLYKEKSIGGLAFAILDEDSLNSFGSFLMVLLALSTVANNIPNMYSIALSAQSVWSGFSKIPRVFWTIAGNFATLAICIPGYYKFEAFMDNFMNLIGYYLSIYQSLVVSEHFIYNRGDMNKYDYENYKDPKAYPIGYAGLFGFCCGVVGVVLGMGQTWYTGVIGVHAGNYGDIGSELGFAFAFAGYNLARPFEKKYIGR
jgi:NCS1 nucleoside transporter family